MKKKSGRRKTKNLMSRMRTDCMLFSFPKILKKKGLKKCSLKILILFQRDYRLRDKTRRVSIFFPKK